MSEDKDHPQDDLESVGRWLRDERPQASPLQLDQIKMRAMAGAGPAKRKSRPIRSRALVGALTVGLMGATTGGVMAAGLTNSSGTKVTAAISQYTPPPSCPMGSVLTVDVNIAGLQVCAAALVNRACPPGFTLTVNLSTLADVCEKPL